MNSERTKIAALVSVAVIALAGVLAGAVAGWAAEDVSRVVMAAVAAVLLLAGVWPKGGASGPVSALLAVMAGEGSSILLESMQ